MAAQKYTRMTYRQASELWHRYEDRNRARGYVKVAPNTTMRQENGGPMGQEYVIRFHDTDIVTIRRDNSYVLNHSGFQTMTTKARIIQFAPIRLWQRRGVWYVLPADTGLAIMPQAVPFVNGMVVR